MNVKFAILSTIAIIAASSTVQAAYAGDRPGARFSFAPSTYRLEEARIPAGYGQPAPSNHSVTHGSMPKGTSLLGFDPKMLAPRPQLIARVPRVAPIVQNSVGSNVSFTSAVPMRNPVAPVGYSGQFGLPLSAPPVMASLPPQARPQVAQAKPLAPVSANSNLNGKIYPRRSSNNVSGRMAKPARGLAAKQGSPIQSYGNNFYQAGSTVPTGSGISTNTNVSGRIIYKSTAKH